MILRLANSTWTIPIIFLTGLVLNNCSQTVVSNAWAISLVMKKIIEVTLPIIIFTLISSGLISLGRKGFKTIIISLFAVFVFNFSFFWAVYPLMNTPIFNIDQKVLNKLLSSSTTIYEPAWSFNIPLSIGSEKGLMLGVIIWLISLFYTNHNEKIMQIFPRVSSYLMSNILAPVVPIFLFGFILNVNLSFLKPVLFSYSHLLVVLSILQYGLLFLILFASEGKRVFFNIKYAIPAVLVGFTTMSSGMAIEKVISGLEKVGLRKNFTSPILSIICLPFTWGDIFVMPSLLIIVTKVFGLPPIDLHTYFLCALYFAILKHSCCSMAGGCAICILPLMTGVLHFTDEMCTLMIAMTIAIDAFSTASNVSGHFMLPIMLKKFFKDEQDYRNTRNS